MTKAVHIDVHRSECPACIAHDALTEKVVAAAKAQLACTDPTDGHIAADHLARLILESLGVDGAGGGR